MTSFLTRVICLSALLFSACHAKKDQSVQHTSDPEGQAKIRTCPDEWIENRMPSANNAVPEQYFIINGERHEIKDFDLDWIRNNCATRTPQIVY